MYNVLNVYMTFRSRVSGPACGTLYSVAPNQIVLPCPLPRGNLPLPLPLSLLFSFPLSLYVGYWWNPLTWYCDPNMLPQYSDVESEPPEKMVSRGGAFGR